MEEKEREERTKLKTALDAKKKTKYFVGVDTNREKRNMKNRRPWGILSSIPA